MSPVAPVSRERIRAVLDKRSVRHKIDKDGDLVVSMSADEDVPYDVAVFLSIENEYIFAVRAIPSAEIAQDKQSDAILFANKWNKVKRWPKAFLHDGYNRVVGELHHDLEQGVHDELLEDMVRMSISASWAMFKELAKTGM